MGPFGVNHSNMREEPNGPAPYSDGIEDTHRLTSIQRMREFTNTQSTIRETRQKKFKKELSLAKSTKNTFRHAEEIARRHSNNP